MGDDASCPQAFEHPMDMEEFRQKGKEMVDWICDYYRTVGERPVRSSVEPGYLAPQIPDKPPQQGEAWADIMADIDTKIMPGVTHWQSPNFFAYYPANSSAPGMLGEMLSAALNIIGFSWIGSPAATELESIVLDWLAQLLALPPAFRRLTPDGRPGEGGGVIQGSASEATLVALLAARTQACAAPEEAHKLVAYASDQAHSSLKKACMIAGISHCRLLPATAANEWAMEPQALQTAIREDKAQGLLPFFLFTVIGTTSTCAVDPLPLLGPIASEHKLWMHVDAAYAGAAAVVPETRRYFQGLEHVDSFNMNAHKWLLTNFDCSPLWVKRSEPLKQALSLTPPYLRAKGNALDLKDWQIPLGRRFRALKLWFVIRTYGAEGLQEYIRHHLRLAKLFEEFVQKDPRFEICAPPRLGLVCFRLRDATREQNAALLEALNSSGRLFLVHTDIGGELILRFALGSTQVQQQHVEAAWLEISQQADKLLSRGAA